MKIIEEEEGVFVFVFVLVVPKCLEEAMDRVTSNSLTTNHSFPIPYFETRFTNW